MFTYSTSKLTVLKFPKEAILWPLIYEHVPVENLCLKSLSLLQKFSLSVYLLLDDTSVEMPDLKRLSHSHSKTMASSNPVLHASSRLWVMHVVPSMYPFRFTYRLHQLISLVYLPDPFSTSVRSKEMIQNIPPFSIDLRKTDLTSNKIKLQWNLSIADTIGSLKRCPL